MAYNVFYTSIPVLVSVLDKDLSEETVMQHPQILFYCQAGRLVFQNLSCFSEDFYVGKFHQVTWYLERFIFHLWWLLISVCHLNRLLNPSTFAGWFGRSLFHVSDYICMILLNFRTLVCFREVFHNFSLKIILQRWNPFFFCWCFYHLDARKPFIRELYDVNL